MEKIRDMMNFQAISVFQNVKKTHHNYLKINNLQNQKDFLSFKFCKQLIINSI